MERQLFVSTNGNDRNDGSESNPFATIVRARDEVRQLKNAVKNTNFTVIIRGGFYKLENTVVFGIEDSGNANQQIKYIAYPGEKPVFSSGRKISGWYKADFEIPGLNPSAVGKIWVADVRSSGIKEKFYSLYDGDQKLLRACSKGFAPMNDFIGWYGTEEEHTSINYPADAPFRKWENIDDIEIVLRSVAVWQMSYIPLSDVDIENKIAKLDGRSLYRISKMMYWNDNSESIWIENAVDFIDEPGKWAYNSKESLIYYWPNGDIPGDNINIPKLKELFKIEGVTDDKGFNDIPVCNIGFEGLTFIHGERDVWPKDYRGFEMQHSWSLYDHDDSMLRFRVAENCSVINCKFISSSSGGIRFDLYAKKNNVIGCEFKDIGGSAIVFCGYGPGKKDVNTQNTVHNNSIKRIGQSYWHSPGIFVWQSSENKITNNYIDDVPYTAIVVSGRIVFDKSGLSECSKTIRWHEIPQNYDSYEKQLPFLHSRDNLIARNEISNAVKVIADGDGIYISGAGKGNIIRNNYIHDCESIHFCDGIRCDDNQIETVIDGNIIYSPGGLGTGICIKGKNTITNNIIYMSQEKPFRGFISMELGPVDGAIIQNNILYATKEFQDAYFIGVTYGSGPTPVFDNTFTDNNIYFNENLPGWGKNVIQKNTESKVDINSIEVDPKFYDIKNKDFRMYDDSPVFNRGFRIIKIEDIGLIK